MSPRAGQLSYSGMETWSLADWEKHAIAFALRISGGNKTKAADLLKISRQTLRTKIKEYGLGDAGEDD